MKRSMRENLVFTAVALALLGGLVLFGCSRSEQQSENAPHEQDGGHDHDEH